MKPGYLCNNHGLPDIPITTSVNLTSTSYLFSDAYAAGTCVQAFLCAKATLGAGVTSVELKFQQCLSDDPTNDWYDWPLVDVANKTTVTNEYVSIVKSYVLRIDANAVTDKLGPIPFPLLMPFFRLAFKVTGVGTANIGVLIGRASL